MSTETDTVQVSRSYLLEKGQTALSELGAIYDTLERTDLSEGRLRDELRSHLSVALYDFTKVLSEISGTTWHPEDREKVASGIDGVEELLVRYGCLKEESTRAWRVRTAGSRILELSKLSKAEARTFMFDELRRIPPDMQPFSELAEILEQVTMGERPWSDLQQWCEVQLTDFAPKPPIQAQ